MNLSGRLLPHNNFSRFKIPWSAVFTSFIQRKLTFSRIPTAPVNVTLIRTYNIKKNVPWHILAPRAVACDNLHLRASAHHWHVSAFCVIGNSSEFPITSKRPPPGSVLSEAKVILYFIIRSVPHKNHHEGNSQCFLLQFWIPQSPLLS